LFDPFQLSMEPSHHEHQNRNESLAQIHNSSEMEEYGAQNASLNEDLNEPQNVIIKLALAQPLNQYNFPDKTFSLFLSLVDQYGQSFIMPSSEDQVCFKIELLHADTQRLVTPGVLKIENKGPLVIGAEGTCEVQMKIAEDASRNNSITNVLRKYLFCISSTNRSDLEELIAGPMTIVRYRLEVRSNPARPIPKDWYKDEGGRENCIEMFVYLKDRDGQEVNNRKVKLRLVLLYEIMDKVQNQEILKLSPDCKTTTGDEGKAMLKLRIEEVSKNHQRQAFRVKVEPDIEDNPTAVDISSDVSPPISVYSKRIRKKQRRRDDVDRRHPNPSPPLDDSIKGENWDHDGNVQSSVHNLLNTVRSSNQAAQLTGAWSALDLMSEASTGPALYNAVKSIIQWTGTVVSGLTVMQWQQLGFEIKPDGNPDYNRPLFKMENPNNIIDTIIRQYANETMQNLLVLLKHVETGGHDINGENQDETSSNMGTTPRHGELQDGHPRSNKRFRAGDPSLSTSYDGLILQNQNGSVGQNTNGQSHQPRLPSHMEIQNHGNFDMKDGNGRNIPQRWETNNGSNGHGLSGKQVDEHMRAASPNISSFHQAGSMGWADFIQPPLLSQKSMNAILEKKGIMDHQHMNAEGCVAYILAKIFHTNNMGKAGLPAYDSSFMLVGFYKESMDSQNGDTKLVLDTLDRIPSIREDEIKAALNVLQQEKEKGSYSVFDIKHFPNLEKMKEAASSYFWKKLSKIERG